MPRKVAAQKVKKKPTRRGRSLARVPKKYFMVVDAKGEVFNMYDSRSEAFDDAVGPRFYRGYAIVEFKRTGARWLKYTATKREATGHRE